MNFYKIEKEQHVDDLMLNNPDKLFVLLLSVENDQNYPKSCINNTNIIKKNIKNKLLTNNIFNDIFLFINLNKYFLKENKYTQNLSKTMLPCVIFYYNNEQLLKLPNVEYSKMELAYNNTKELIKIKAEEKMQQEIIKIKKISAFEELKNKYLINELLKLKKAKEIEENIDNNTNK